ncbi:MAG: arylesterase [Gammaproteobacteria bacterium]
MRQLLTLLALMISMTTPASADRILLVLGDSLSAAYGIAQEDGWVSLMSQRIKEDGGAWQVANASISGETTAGGLTRLPELLKPLQPALVLIALGSNDALQGKPPSLLRANLEKMASQARDSGADVVIIGNQVPPNYGPQYTQRMFDTYREVSESLDTHYIPFLLEAVATDENLFQADRLHPTAEAQPLILDTVWPTLAPLLE